MFLREERDGHTAAAIAGGQIMLLNGGGNGNGEIAGDLAALQLLLFKVLPVGCISRLFFGLTPCFDPF